MGSEGDIDICLESKICFRGCFEMGFFGIVFTYRLVRSQIESQIGCGKSL